MTLLADKSFGSVFESGINFHKMVKLFPFLTIQSIKASSVGITFISSSDVSVRSGGSWHNTIQLEN